jgi:lipopolysaccharide transport system ATP-binding protein
VLGLTKKEINRKLDEIIDFAEIGEFIDSPVQSYSSGMQVRLGFAVATALDPDVLILDEVLAVGDTGFRVKCFNRMCELLDNAAVIFVSHIMSQITRVSSRALLLNHGKAVIDSSDLGTVIEQYHNTAIGHSQSGRHEHGEGSAKILDVRVRPLSGSCDGVIRHGDPFALSIDLVLLNVIPDHLAKLLITINDEELHNVAQINEAVDLTGRDYVNKRLEIKFTFDAAQFNSGKYSLTVSLTSGSRGKFNCVVSNAATILAAHSIVGYAPILLTPRTISANIA